MTNDALSRAFSGAGDLVLLGCGKMGGALLDGWLANGAPSERIALVEPRPSPSLAALAEARGLRLEPTADAFAPGSAAVLLIAVKPQMLDEALPSARGLPAKDGLVVSIAAGAPIARFQAAFGSDAAIVRTMPNTPSAIGAGITALAAAADVTPEQRARADALLAVVGETVWLDREADMDAVTAVSGSGPAYVFHMIEALAAAGAAEGLAPELAMRLARATVSGAGALAAASDESAEQLRVNVTSPGGTTAAGLEPLMDGASGLPSLMRRTVAAAAARSRALGG